MGIWESRSSKAVSAKKSRTRELKPEGQKAGLNAHRQKKMCYQFEDRFFQKNAVSTKPRDIVAISCGSM